MRRLLGLCFLVASVTSCASERIGDGNACRMPVAAFNFSYMSSLLSATKAPNEQSFLKSVSNNIDASKMQFFLWYVYNNPSLAHKFFSRINVESLVDENDDGTNSILWLMVKKGGFFEQLDREKISPLLYTWKSDFKKRNPQRNWLLDVYQTDRINEERPAEQGDTTEDVDVELRLGVDAEKRGRLLEALFFYTRAAEAGSQQGLVGASLLLPQIGGQKCVSRAAYYALISGAIGPVLWYPEPHGGN